MGQKVNPISFRIGINKTWDSRWFAAKHYGNQLIQDVKIRSHINSLKNGEVSKVVIERSAKKVKVTIHTAKPRIVIGPKGAGIEKMQANLTKITESEVFLNVVEIKKPESDATIVALNIARQIEKRTAVKRAMKKAIPQAFRAGALGVKINCSGRLGGAEIARSEWYKEGQIPLHTLRADIDYGTARANTTYGVIGIKVWVYKGLFIENENVDYDNK